MIYYVNPDTSSALRPYTPSVQNVQTSQLGLNNVYVHSSGIGYMTLPLIANLDNLTADLTVICVSSDANISILPSGTDKISTPSGGLIGSGDSPLNFSALGSVFEIKVADAGSGIWFAVGNNLG